jgi:hypothetical protein
MTPTTLKFLLFQYVICHNAKYLTSEEGDMEKLHNMLYPPKSKVFTTNCQYNCNSFFKVDMIASSFDTILPKKKSSSSIMVN